MKVDDHAATFFAPADVATEYRWSFPHHLAAVVRVCETGETVLAIARDNGLPVDERGRTPSPSGIQGEASSHIAAVIQDRTPMASPASTYVKDLEAKSVMPVGFRRSGLAFDPPYQLCARELWKPFRYSGI